MGADKGKDPHKEAIERRRAVLNAIVDNGRKATSPLYVMLEPADKQRYDELAKELGLSMRDLVRMALERLVQERNATAHQGDYRDLAAAAVAALPSGRVLDAGTAAFGDPLRASLAQTQRIGRLEDRVEQLERRLDNNAIR